MLGAIAVIGLVFSPIAGAMAFAITYEEYRRHHLRQRDLVLRSLEAALVATAFFALLTLGLGVLVPHLIEAPS